MKCNKCGTEVNPQDEFCYNCGEQITRKTKNKKDKQKNKPEVQEYKLKDKEIEKLSQSFASRDEKYIASLGNGYIMNYLTNGSMSKGFAFITDKRVYFKGSCLSGTGKKLVKTDEERTVDIKNITGSGFTYHRYLGILIALFISLLASIVGVVGSCYFYYNIFLRYFDIPIFSIRALIFSIPIMPIGYSRPFLIASGLSITLLIASCIGIKNYLFKRKTLFRIEYAGGCIAFDVSFYAKAEIDDFQKQLRRTKDFSEETSTIKTVTVDAPVQTATQNSVPDDLRKYADLLKDGLISQEEYDAMKKKVLGL